MSRSPGSHELRNIVITLVVLLVLIAGAAFATFGLGGGDDDGGEVATGITVVTTTPAPTIPTPTTAPSVNYQVQRGDSLTRIARRFGVSVPSIEAANQLSDPDHLTEGQTLVINRRALLVVSPTSVAAGRSVGLEITGLQPSAELITFEIRAPDRTFQGPPHNISSNGTVTTTYAIAGDRPTGIYTVVAKGDLGTNVEASFEVRPPSP